MVSNDRKFRNATFLKSFQVAISGITTVFKEEKNFRFHIVSTVMVVSLGLFFSLSIVEWLFVLSAIFGVLTFEMINSAIERVVDLVTNEYHPLAKVAKDMGSGAVLLFAMYSVLVGIMIFVPKIWSLLIFHF